MKYADCNARQKKAYRNIYHQAAVSYLKDIRFCGKEWLMARCEARIKKAGY